MGIMTYINIKLVFMVIFDLWALKQILEVKGRGMKLLYMGMMFMTVTNIGEMLRTGEADYYGLFSRITFFMAILLIATYIILFSRIFENKEILIEMEKRRKEVGPEETMRLRKEYILKLRNDEPLLIDNDKSAS